MRLSPPSSGPCHHSNEITQRALYPCFHQEEVAPAIADASHAHVESHGTLEVRAEATDNVPSRCSQCVTDLMAQARKHLENSPEERRE